MKETHISTANPTINNMLPTILLLAIVVLIILTLVSQRLLVQQPESLSSLSLLVQADLTGKIDALEQTLGSEIQKLRTAIEAQHTKSTREYRAFMAFVEDIERRLLDLTDQIPDLKNFLITGRRTPIDGLIPS